MKNKYMIITVIVVLIVAAGSFYAGMQYQRSQRNAFFAGVGAGGQRGFGGRFGQGQRRNFTPVAGDITEADDKSITVKMPDGSSKIVILSDSTTINKSATAQKSDLKTGEKVAVFGTQNSDGSVTAQTIQLNPQMRIMMQRPSGQPAQ